ncbi:MAG: mechanosensitive ion channel family protein [Rubrivivax sp.]
MTAALAAPAASAPAAPAAPSAGLGAAASPAQGGADFAALLEGLLHRSAALEALGLLALLVLAWLVTRGVRGREAATGSIWFGERLVDGLLFPLMALLLAVAVRWGLNAHLVSPVFAVAVPILLSLAVIRLVVKVLHRAFPTSSAMRVVERSISWLAWVTVVAWITGLLPLVLHELDSVTWTLGSTRISVRNLLEGLLSAALVLVLALWVSAALEARLLAGAEPGRADSLSVRKMAANALRALLMFIGLMLALSAAGIDLTALGVLGGALGVGLGFGLQKLAANYVSGFVILAERSMRIGDLVRVDNFEGRITDINTRFTKIRAPNGRESIAPNEMLITQRVENASLADDKLLLNTVVQVAYGTDVPALIPVLEDALRHVPRVLSDPPPSVLLTQFAPDGLELTIVFWIGDPENGQNNARSAVNLTVLQLFEARGVQIPFPQRVVHMAPPAAALMPRSAP